jgi:ion channel-forming bestrophin family protein
MRQSFPAELRQSLRELLSSPTLSRVAMYAILVSAYAIIPAWFHDREKLSMLSGVPSDIHAALTLVLGWLLVFRTNTSYGRWWEARTLWGSLVNTMRNLSLKLVNLIEVPKDELSRLRKILTVFAPVLKDHLRDGALLDDDEVLGELKEIPRHVPSFLVSLIYSRLREWKRAGEIDGQQLIVIDEDLRKLLEIVGGCERIRNTRLARSYRAFARQCVFLYLATLPWGIVHNFGWWTVPLTAILSYFMLGLETVAEHTEEPFGMDEDDLDLEAMCHTIDASVTEIFSHGRANGAA